MGHEGEGGHGFARAPEMARADRDQGAQISVPITCVEPAVPPHHRQAPGACRSGPSLPLEAPGERLVGAGEPP